jgi:DNA-binding LacI/PurR family transcriptional regulator
MIDRAGTGNANRPKPHNARPTIGFLVHSITDDHGSELWAGAIDATRALDANLICFRGNYLESSDGFMAQGNVIYQLASAENVDGLVFSSATLAMYVSSDVMQRIADKYHLLPRASLGLPLNGIPSLLLDNYEGMRKVISHLIEDHGFRRIALISGPQGSPEFKIRYQAYVDVLDEYGLPLNPALVSPPTTWKEATGREAIGVLLDERGLQPGLGFEAVAASNDETAVGVLNELQARGFHVPGDVSVTGFDGFKKGEYCTPPLTSVRQPAYEQAYLAVEMVLAQLRGEDVPYQRNMPTELLIRQSCGCPDPVVTQAAVGQIPQPQRKATAGETLPVLLKTYSDQIHTEMIKAAGTALEGLDPALTKELLAAFSDDVMGKSTNAFGLALDMAIRQTAMMNREVKTWQSILSAHRRQVLPLLSEKEHLYRAEDLWQQARVSIAEATYRFRAYRESLANQQAAILRHIGETMITTFDLTESIEALTTGLPGLGIPGCYLALYEFPEQPEKWSNLIFAHNETGQVSIPRGGLRFPSLQLIPDNLRTAHKLLSAVVEPLYFREQQLGFVLLEVGPSDGTIYESLSGQISSMLQGALLMQQVQQHTAQLDTIVTETLATSEEMQVTIAETSRQAQAVADAAQQSVDVSKTGQDAVADTVAGMETIQRQVSDIAQSILALSERTQRIGEIISAVEEIADQSRLLALNASIEAARAGDEGLGFAVVAREMRHLADQSREATAKVSGILNEIQRAANTAVIVTEEGSKGAQSGMGLASQAGVAIRDLTAIIEEAARVAIQIAASTHQQTSAMDQLVAAIKSIKQASTQTTTSIKEAGF